MRLNSLHTYLTEDVYQLEEGKFTNAIAIAAMVLNGLMASGKIVGNTTAGEIAKQVKTKAATSAPIRSALDKEIKRQHKSSDALITAQNEQPGDAPTAARQARGSAEPQARNGVAQAGLSSPRETELEP